jgi:hypothetical protein
MLKSYEVTQKIYSSKTPGKKAAATRLLTRYVEQQEKLGFSARQTLAGIKAALTRKKNKKK